MSAATEIRGLWGAEPPRRTRDNQPVKGRSAWKVGRLFGIGLYVHPTFVLLLAWVAISHLSGGAGAVWRGLALVLSVFAIVVLHELGHALMARRFGVRTRDITLLPIGGVARLERMPDRPIEELLVAVAGPAVNVLFALSLWAALTVAGSSTRLTELSNVGGSLLTKLMWVNVSLAVFNLLPAFPMDGGRVLRAALAFRMDYLRATETAARIGQGMALLFGAVGLFYNPMLILIAFFVWVGARAESTAAGLKRALSGVPVASAMLTEFRTLSSFDQLASAAASIVAGFQHDFPVIDGTQLVGVLTRGDVVQGLSENGGAAPVASAMHREFVVIQATELLENVLSRRERSDQWPLVVVQDGRVVGLMTVESIGDFILMHSRRDGEAARSRASTS